MPKTYDRTLNGGPLVPLGASKCGELTLRIFIVIVLEPYEAGESLSNNLIERIDGDSHNLSTRSLNHGEPDAVCVALPEESG